ncbi:sodium ion-translocating decarboxylase subunit beta [Crassaminicella profunda]|uniref:sodium ion-translocating decarboxylase subunit beta n=1 Tax=Crassaminicella profunda TaxID=1286698 RepID=UPI001CA6C4F4|nr:sodium ion-translocating decarboxylase subunit beta [Crassaminicella profunda]QZY54161.1 sodium ion-translocating decarboxylase subunit beta [Crassaminicella profunda]
MKKVKILKIATYVSGAITILLGFIYFFKDFIWHMLFKMPSESASSIGIIGGADGPTAIFIATSTGISLELLIFIFGGITTILFLLKRILKKNS